MSADEIAALSDTLARKTHCLLVVAADELGVGGDPVIDRRIRVARTQTDSAARGLVGFLPAPAIGKRQA